MGLLDGIFGGGKTLSAAQAKAEMDTDKDLAIVDVREPGEFKGGHIPGAKLMPLQTLANLAPSEIPDKATRVLVYCKAGGRAASAVRVLEQLGYTNAISFGGIDGWPYEIV
ncbi:MAG: rhodanese-like domain-containing protein [Coriobacteriales bacterium]|jgi:rhodanese-related sulfurtransferase|nr:rhodanese-like domain-containing protein [Coriobacteriales bacterium]